MSDVKFVKVFAGVGVYHGLVPASMVQMSEEDSKRYAEQLRGVDLTALYLMQHLEDGCRANCAFCIQARESVGRRKQSVLIDKDLIRIPLEMVTTYLRDHPGGKKITRVCIQTVLNPRTVENLADVVTAIRKVSDVSLTACCVPVPLQDMVRLKQAGLEYMTINYEAATPELFNNTRGKGAGGPYRWEKVGEAVKNALDVFGPGKVGSHLQVGLGETQKEGLEAVQSLVDRGLYVSLFAFTPIPGTSMSDRVRTSHQRFHQMQLGGFLIRRHLSRVETMRFNEDGELVDYGMNRAELEKLVDSGMPFRNAGCPGCNRVYYETNPGETYFSYPRALHPHEVASVKSMVM